MMFLYSQDLSNCKTYENGCYNNFRVFVLSRFK